jgi:hypothetical protein
MTTKAELITEIGTSYTLGSLIHETPLLSVADQALFSAENLKIYRQIAHEQIEGKMTRRAIAFYVSDEGGGGEAAFYKDRKPIDAVRLEAVSTFRATVETEIATRVTAGTLLRGKILEINEANKWAVVRVFREVTGEANEENYLAYEKLDTSLGFMKANLI